MIKSQNMYIQEHVNRTWNDSDCRTVGVLEYSRTQKLGCAVSVSPRAATERNWELRVPAPRADCVCDSAAHSPPSGSQWTPSLRRGGRAAPAGRRSSALRAACAAASCRWALTEASPLSSRESRHLTAEPADASLSLSPLALRLTLSGPHSTSSLSSSAGRASAGPRRVSAARAKLRPVVCLATLAEALRACSPITFTLGRQRRAPSPSPTQAAARSPSGYHTSS